MQQNENIFLEALCYHDPRNPDFAALHCYLEPGEPGPEPRNHCHCDNCFYGRDKLATAALVALETARQEVKEARARGLRLAAWQTLKNRLKTGRAITGGVS